MSDVMEHSDTSCDLLEDSEIEVGEFDANVMDVTVSPNFIQYDSEERPLHIKVVQQAIDTKHVKTEDITEHISKRWKLRIKLSDRKINKMYMDRVKRRRKLQLQRKLRRQSVKRKASSPVSCTSTSCEETDSESISQKCGDMQELSVTNSVQSSSIESDEMVSENESKTEQKPRVLLSVETLSNCANHEETIAESNKAMADCKPVGDFNANVVESGSENMHTVTDFNGNVVESGSENTDIDATMKLEHGIVERSENTDINDSVVKSDGLTSSELSVTLHDKEYTDGVSSEVASELYYVIGTPISRPKDDPKTENLNWFLTTFEREIVIGDSSPNDLFEAVLSQCDLKNLSAEDLRGILKEYVVQERGTLEPLIRGNLNARNISYNQFVSFLCGNKTSGFDITLKCISFMLKKAIMVIAEDYLWLSHTRPFENFDLLFVLFKGGEFAAAKSRSGTLVQCQLPEIQKYSQDDDNAYSHEVMNRSDSAKCVLIAQSTDNCDSIEEEKKFQTDISPTENDSLSVSKVAEISVSKSEINQADITTTDPDASNNLEDHEPLHENVETTDAGNADDNFSPSIIQPSMPVPADTSELNPDTGEGQVTRSELSSEMDKTDHETSVPSSYKETSTEGDRTLTGPIPNTGK